MKNIILLCTLIFLSGCYSQNDYLIDAQRKFQGCQLFLVPDNFSRFIVYPKDKCPFYVEISLFKDEKTNERNRYQIIKMFQCE